MTEDAAGKMPVLRPENPDHQFKDLKQKLLGAYSTIFARSLAKEAADAIRQQATEITNWREGYDRLDKYCAQQAERIAELERTCITLDDLCQERFEKIAELQAKLSRWESQKVVAWMYSDGLIYTLLPKFMQVLATPLIASLPDDEEYSSADREILQRDFEAGSIKRADDK